MAEEFSIKITGVKEVQAGLKKMEENLAKTDEPLTKSGRFMQLEAFANFPEKGGRFGESWPPYKPPGWQVSATGRRYWFPGSEEIKKRAGFGGQPLMVRTGALFGGFQVRKGKNFAEVFNPIRYAILHQKGIGNLPRRVLLNLA